MRCTSHELYTDLILILKQITYIIQSTFHNQTTSQSHTNLTNTSNVFHSQRTLNTKVTTNYSIFPPINTNSKYVAHRANKLPLKESLSHLSPHWARVGTKFATLKTGPHSSGVGSMIRFCFKFALTEFKLIKPAFVSSPGLSNSIPLVELPSGG